jgi:hypothetical protein
MLTTIKRYYEQGHIVMEEDAPVHTRTQVMITFLTDDTGMEHIQKRMPGALKGKVSIPDDFNEPLELC